MPKYYFNGQLYDSEYLAHYGRKGMKWGKNIFVTPDNTGSNPNNRRATPRLLLKKRNSRGYINPQAAWRRPNQKGYFDKDNPIDNNGLHERDSRDIGRLQEKILNDNRRHAADYKDYSDNSLRKVRDEIYAPYLTEESDQKEMTYFHNSGIAYISHIDARASMTAINRELESRKLANKVKNWASNLVKTTTSTIKNSSAYKVGASVFSALFSNKPVIGTRKTITVGNNIPGSKPLFGATAAVSAQQALKKTQKITNRTGRR